MIRKVVQLGQSRAIIIPSNVCMELDIDLGDHVSIMIQKIIDPASVDISHVKCVCGEIGNWTRISKRPSPEGENAYKCNTCGEVDVF